MRWNLVLGALVVSLGLCGQSFGLELLDRMLGLNNCGNSCCTAAAPSCGCGAAAEPTCAAAAPAEPTCCAAAPACEPACNAAPACEPSCCAAPACGHCRKHGCGLFAGIDGWFSHHKSCCTAAPSCGCAAAPTCAAEPTCNAAPCEAAPCCCAKKRCCLHNVLGIFHHNKCCHEVNCCNAAPSCGCNAAPSCGGGGDPAPAMATPRPSDDAYLMPPAPSADPSASLIVKRRVASNLTKLRATN